MDIIKEEKCEAIIHSASVLSGVIGASPIPGSDAVPLVATQMAMIIALGSVFNVTIEESYAKTLAKEFAVKQAGKMIAGSLSKLIPGLGSAVNATVAFGLTEVLGWEVARDFSQKAA